MALFQQPAEEIHRRARIGIRLMLSRRLVILLMTFATGVVLARTLTPSDFGLFAIALFVTSLVRMLAELGFSQVLIQRPGALEVRALQTAFTIEHVVAVAAFALLWVAAPTLARVYPEASTELVPLVRIMSLQLLVLAWSDMSETILERSLDFDRVAPIEVLGSVASNATSLSMALAGWGAWSLAAGVLAGIVVRAVLAYRAAPWPLGFAFDRDTAALLLGRGFAIQVERLVTQGQYWVAPTLVAGTIGTSATGLLQWAAGNGKKPIEILQSAVRVSLPHFSLLQHDVREVERILARYVTAFALISGLWLVVLALAGADLVAFVYGAPWVPAAPAMTIFAAAGLLASGAVIVTSALISLGRMAFAARVSMATAAATLLASVGFVVGIGPLGVPLGQLVGAAIAFPWLVSGIAPGALGRVLPATRAILAPMVAAFGVGLVVRAVAHAGWGDALAPGVRGLVSAGAMTLAFGATAWWWGPRWLRQVALTELLATVRPTAARD